MTRVTSVVFVTVRAWYRFRVISLALSLLTLTSANPALAQQGQTINPLLRTITISGRGVETIPTTLAQVRLGVEAQGKTALEVQQEVARRSTAVITLLRSRQVEKLETTGINLNPLYSYNNSNNTTVQRLTGYSATNTVSFRLNTERVGTLVDEAVKAGATRIDGISFVATDSALAAAQQQALRKATQDAQRQANSVLSVLDFSPKEVVSIQVNNTPYQPLPIAHRRGGNLADSAASTPVVGGEQQIETSVTLQIRY